MAVAKHGPAALVLLLLLAAHSAAAQRSGSFRQFNEEQSVAVAGREDNPSAVKSVDAEAVAAAAGSTVNTGNSFDLCYNLNVNSTLAFVDVAWWQGKYLEHNQFMGDMTCYLQWLPVRQARVNGVLTPLTCDCLASNCNSNGQPCCKNMVQWRAANNWAVGSSYVWRSPPTSGLGDGYVCEWIQTRPVKGFGIIVASVSYSVVTLT
ncbi:hypothetical protein COO60DRAFT_1689146 [Scenedesmus sp. NREL 46B-D3]|nr:hypothetical protein COO60DRAFT_1689146 [Scenedesmus sp. NREL 46B-D3]